MLAKNMLMEQIMIVNCFNNRDIINAVNYTTIIFGRSPQISQLFIEGLVQHKLSLYVEDNDSVYYNYIYSRY